MWKISNIKTKMEFAKKKAKSKNELEVLCNDVPQKVRKQNLPHNQDEINLLIDKFDKIYHYKNWAGKYTTGKTPQILQALEDRIVVNEFATELYEEQKQNFYTISYCNLSLAYKKGLGVDKNTEKKNVYAHKDWLCFVSTNPEKYYEEHNSLSTLKIKQLYEDFANNCRFNPLVRADYDRIEDMLLSKVKDTENKFFYLYFCMLIELISLRNIGMDKAQMFSQAEEIEKKAIKEYFDVFAIYRKEVMQNESILLFKEQQELILRHPAVALEFEFYDSNERYIAKGKQMQARMKELAPNINAEKAKEFVDEITKKYYDYYYAIHREEIEAEIEKKQQAELEEARKSETAKLYYEGMNLYSTAISDEQMNGGLEKIKLSAKGGFVEAQRALVDIMAENGDADAQCILGDWYLYGKEGKPEDKSLAFSWFSKAARQKHPRGTYYLAYAIENGFNGVEDKEQARAIYHRSAEYGYPGGMMYVANECVVNNNYDDALRWLKKTAYCKGYDASDKKYVVVATEKLITLCFPDDGKPDKTTHSTFLHVLHYIRLCIKALNDKLNNDMRITKQLMENAEKSDVDSVYKLSYRLEKAKVKSLIIRAVELEVIRLFMEKMKNGYDRNTYYRAYHLCGYSEKTHDLAKKFGRVLLDNNDTSMMMQMYYDYYEIFNLSYNERMNYVVKAAQLGDIDAQNVLEIIKINTQRQQEIDRIIEEQKRRQAECERMEKIEDVERWINFVKVGKWETMYQRYVYNEISYEDYYGYKILLNKLDEMKLL